MNSRERFAAIMDYRPADRLPVWWFETWDETRPRWLQEGLADLGGWANVEAVTGMDEHWEKGMWGCHGLVNNGPMFGRARDEVVEETADCRIVRTRAGALLKVGKTGESIPEHLEEALVPTREAWERFKKGFDPHDPARQPPDIDQKLAALNGRQRATCFLGGSLYGIPRDWLGVEQLSYLSYDDPALYEEIIATVTDFFIETHRPVLAAGAEFDFVYIFEDCAGSSGPLFSADTYAKFYHRHYKRLFEFYRSMGVPHILLDSDGVVEPLIRSWMDSGVDILFPIEVGKWRASPVDIRRRYGKSLRLMGGVNKHVIRQGEAAVRRDLERLRGLVSEGGYIPLPDHRIPPDCSFEQFRTYVRVFKDVFRDVFNCGQIDQPTAPPG